MSRIAQRRHNSFVKKLIAPVKLKLKPMNVNASIIVSWNIEA